MKKNKYLLLISSLGVLALLVAAAVSENFLKEWQLIQGASRTDEGAAEVRLRQIVNTDLRTVDRCVSCHVGMAPGEQIVSDFKVSETHKSVVHSPNSIGCTVCHGGQGLATDKADAHGTVAFWTEPMLPAKYAYAGCGTCHTPLEVPNLEVLSTGRKTFERLDCYACHRLDGRGGTIRPGGTTGMEGPDLSHVGLKGYDGGWYAKHLTKFRESGDAVWRNSFGEIGESDLSALAGFLATRMGAPGLVEAQAQYNSLGCAGCHLIGKFGGDTGPNLSRFGEKDPNQLNFNNVPGDKTLSNWIAQHFRSPGSTVAGSQMPILGLTEEQIDRLTLYMLSLRRRTLPDTQLPRDRVRAMRFGVREFASNPETIYGAVCSSCHGANGQGMRYPGLAPNPSIANPDFLSLASDDFLIATIRKGRPGRPMLAWGDRENGLSDDELRALVAYIRQLGGNIQPIPDTMPPLWARGDAAAGERLFTANCAGCHGQRGIGGEGPALGNKVFLENVTDTFLAETIIRGRRGTVMQGFATPSTVRPALTRAEIESIITYIRTLDKKAGK